MNSIDELFSDSRGSLPPLSIPSDASQLGCGTIATFVIASIRAKLLRTSVLRRWGDDIIKKADRPEYWAIELSLFEGDKFDAYRMLEAVPGPLDSKLAAVLASTLMRRIWLRGGATLGEAAGSGWLLTEFWDYNEPETDWSYQTDHLCESVMEKWTSLEAAEREVGQMLERFAPADALIPQWFNDYLIEKPLIMRHVPIRQQCLSGFISADDRFHF